MARLLVDRLGADGLNLYSAAGAMAGQEVFHLHVHLVPRYADAAGAARAVQPARGLGGRARRRARPADGLLRVVSTGRRIARVAVEFLPPFLVALLILPFIIQYGTLRPWHPSTIDLEVYVYAVRDMLAGKDIFATTTPFWNLFFIYPPIAAVLMTPLAFGPYVFGRCSGPPPWSGPSSR